MCAPLVTDRGQHVDEEVGIEAKGLGAALLHDCVESLLGGRGDFGVGVGVGEEGDFEGEEVQRGGG